MDSVKGWLKKKETFTIQLFISVWKKYHEKQHEIGSTAYIYIYTSGNFLKTLTL